MFKRHSMKLFLLQEKFTLNKLPQFAELPHIFAKGELCFVARTDKELTILCPEYMAPNNVQQEGGWRAIKVFADGSLMEPGVLASVVTPLAEKGIPLLAVTTFDSIFIFVIEEKLETAGQTLEKAGHSFLQTIS